jgi:hypothetical protein
MSKKTKRQKVIAAYRNKLRLLQKDQQSEIVTQQEKPLEKQTLNDLPKPNVSADLMLYRTYFLNDFRKSILFIGIILALEIVLYYGTINNYLKLF